MKTTSWELWPEQLGAASTLEAGGLELRASTGSE